MKSNTNAQKAENVERYPRVQLIPEIIEIPPSQIVRTKISNVPREKVDFSKSKINVS
jgi:hypothetical protein